MQEGRNALHYAARRGHVAIAEFLLKHDVAVWQTDIVRAIAEPLRLSSFLHHMQNLAVTVFVTEACARRPGAAASVSRRRRERRTLLAGGGRRASQAF